MWARTHLLGHGHPLSNLEKPAVDVARFLDPFNTFCERKPSNLARIVLIFGGSARGSDLKNSISVTWAELLTLSSNGWSRLQPLLRAVSGAVSLYRRLD